MIEVTVAVDTAKLVTVSGEANAVAVTVLVLTIVMVSGWAEFCGSDGVVLEAAGVLLAYAVSVTVMVLTIVTVVESSAGFEEEEEEADADSPPTTEVIVTVAVQISARGTNWRGTAATSVVSLATAATARRDFCMNILFVQGQ